MNFMMKPMTPRMPIPRMVILVEVVKSSLLGLLMSLVRRLMDSSLGNGVVSGGVCDDWVWASFNFVVGCP